MTRDVCLLARMTAANLHFSQIEELMFEVLLESLFIETLLFLLISCVHRFQVLIASRTFGSSQCGDATMNFVSALRNYTVFRGKLKNIT